MAPAKGNTMKKMKKSNTIERVQALAMHASGQAPKQIESVVGIAPAAFSKMLTKAKNRGYVVGGKIFEEHVCDGKPSNLKGTMVDPSETPTIPKNAKSARNPKPVINQRVKLEPQETDDISEANDAQEADDDTPEADMHMANSEFGFHPYNPFKLEPVEDDEDDYAI